MAETAHFSDVAHWVGSSLDPTFPRDMILDLTLMALGQKAHRTALPLLEAAARLSVDDLGRIAALYVGGLERQKNGYKPLLGASNLARKLLADPEVAKFAATEKADMRQNNPYRWLLRTLVRRINEQPDERTPHIHYADLKHWAMTSSEAELLLARRAEERFRSWFDPSELPRLFWELWREVRLLRKYRQVALAEGRLTIKAHRMLPKELRQIRA